MCTSQTRAMRLPYKSNMGPCFRARSVRIGETIRIVQANVRDGNEPLSGYTGLQAGTCHNFRFCSRAPVSKRFVDQLQVISTPHD
jgi:hypothetical protein